MKIGLSTWSLLSLDVYSAVRAIGESGIDYIELWGEVPHAYPDWIDKKRLRDSLSAFDFTTTIHGPFTDLNPATPFEPVRGAILRTLSDYVELGAYLGASIITFHPGTVHNEKMVSKSSETSASTLRELVKVSDGRLSINFENQTRSHSKYHYPLASTEDSIKTLLSSTEGTHFTLDTGHAHASGLSSEHVADLAGSRLSEVHLSDNAGAADDHLIPGEGSAHLEPLMERFARSDLLVCLELDPHRYSPDQALKGASEFKSRLGRKGGAAN
ncbi:MAG: sugar phosphate isomerase/epimerase [archaeon]|nr:MAG: sugar phosphate isomerase/epimerase [archaeon]